MAEEVISRSLAPSVEAQPSAAPASQPGTHASGASAADAVWLQERSQRLEAEAAAAELRRQLDDVAAVLFGARRPSAAASSSVAETLRAVLVEAAGEAVQQRLRADEAEQHAADAAYVARLVAGMCARAATAADLQARWADERALLERRLEQAARMGQAMLKHQKEHGAGAAPRRTFPRPCPTRGQARVLSVQGVRPRRYVAECRPPASCSHPAAELEPWRQQLLSTAFAVGCSLLGGAAAVLIISRTQA